MIEQVDELNGLKITGIEIRSGDDTESAEHMAYQIIVRTELGWVSISGCHDSGPDATTYRQSIQPIG